jgi:excisionase family DNA binding protein
MTTPQPPDEDWSELPMNGTANTQASQRRTLSVPEAGAMLGISTSSAYRAARDGSLPTIRIRGRVLVLAAALSALMGDPTVVRGETAPDAA